MNLILACTREHAFTAAREWGWPRIENTGKGWPTFQSPYGPAIATSSGLALIGIRPPAIIFLGYHWQYAHGSPHEALTNHVNAGGTVVERQWRDVPFKTWPEGKPWAG